MWRHCSPGASLAPKRHRALWPWALRASRGQRARCYSAYPQTVRPTGLTPPGFGALLRENHAERGWALLVGRTLPVVERLPIVLAGRLIGNPGLEIGPLGVGVIVLVVGAVIPVVPLVRLAVWGLPVVVDMDPVPCLAVKSLLLVFLVVLVAPRILRGFIVAVIVGAIRFAVLEVTIGVVVLGILVAVCGSTLVGQDRRSHEHHRRQQPQEQHQPSQLFLLPKASPYSISRRLEPKTSFP